MPCNQPLEGWRARKQNEATGKYPVVFSGSLANLKFNLTVPCGKCLGCLKDRSTAWGIRCVHESQLHQENSFLTLTYHPDHLPKDGMLKKEHFQKFMKRLRKKTGLKLRYIHCGEYGPKTFRAHYHALIFGYDFSDKQWESDGKNGDSLYTSQELEKLWGYGKCIIGEISFASAQYIAKYIHKLQHFNPLVNLDGYQPPYNTVSRRPGLGIPWLEKHWKDIYPRDEVIINGGKYKVPRAYDKWLEIHKPELFSEVKHARRKKFDEKALDHAQKDMHNIASEQQLKQNHNKRETI